jgi:hypothetical protein
MVLRIHKKKRLAVLSLALVAVASLPTQAGLKIPATAPTSSLLTPVSLSSSTQTKAADGSVIPQEEVSLPSLIKAYIPGLVVGGYYRGYFYGRSMTTPYGINGPQKVLSVGDQTYYGDPNLFLYVGGNVSPTLSFGMELNLVNYMFGPGKSSYTIGIYNTMVMRGSYNAKRWGSYNVVVGGIEWKKISNLTFGGNVRYNRYSVFERRPWDPTGAVKTKYAAYYETGNFNQDARFGTNAFKGVMVSGYNLPFGLTGEFMYGKSGFSGGFNRIDMVRPSHDIAGKLTNKFKNDNEISLNTYTSVVQTDSVNVAKSTPAEYNTFTSDYLFKTAGFTFSGEVGIGKYQSPTYDSKWDGAVIFDVQLPKKYTYIPLSVRYYNIGKGFLNKAASFSNTSVSEVTTGYRNTTGVQALTIPFGGGMNGVGDLANNRQAVNINGEVKVGKFKLVFGNEVTAENDVLASGTTVNVGHTVNGLSISRFSQFPAPGSYGPNSRMNSYYRGVYEVITIDKDAVAHKAMTDKNKNAVYTIEAFRKYYNALEAQLKYKNKFLGRDFYIFQMNTFTSCQDKLSPITLFNDAALIHARVHEIDFYYHLTRDLMIDVYGGYERIISNNQTKDARDQTGTAIGLGFDLAITSSTALYYRHRWYDFDDANAPTEHFKGTEGTVELKIYF